MRASTPPATVKCSTTLWGRDIEHFIITETSGRYWSRAPPPPELGDSGLFLTQRSTYAGIIHFPLSAGIM